MLSGWVLVVVFNSITAAAYLGIVLFIVRGLRRTRQLSNNRLAVATAAIFLTCAAHHLLHAWHLFESSGMNGDLTGMASMRDSMGGSLDVVVTATTALAGVVYLGLRRYYARLLGSPSMFEGASDIRYRQLAANLPHTVVFVVDTDLRFLLIEGAGLEGSGYDRTKMEGRLLRDAVPPEVYAHLRPHYQAAVDGHESNFDSVSEMTGKVFEVRARPMFDGSSHIVGAMVLAEDVTNERRVMEELERAKEFRDAVLTASPDITTVTDVRTGRLTWASRSLLSLLDGTAIDLTDPAVVREDADDVRAADHQAASLPDGESLTIRYRVRDAAGETRWLSRRSTPFRRGQSGDAAQVLSVVREVTDVVEAERALERAALQDPLTGLPNRMLLLERVGSAIDRSERTGSVAAVLFCDLDGFKGVNDTGGHAAGDAVLVEVARRLRSILRAGDSIARVGGDEFVLVVDALPPGVESDPGASLTATDSVVERIRGVLSAPIEHDGIEYIVSASIGLVLVHAGTSAHEVLRDADSAMYRAKMLGKNRIELFDDTLRASVLDRAHIEQTLRQALDPSREGAATLSVAYQPVYQLGTGRLVGFEALARVSDADGTSIAPDRFIPLAEETGLITELGYRVLDDALAMLVHWRAAHPPTSASDPRITIAVNLSARQAQHVDMFAVVGEALTRHQLQPSDLILELTESVLLESGNSLLQQIGELRSFGVGIAIDDFGTGFACLRYLATLPVTAVKIDRSFTASMTSDPTSNSIVKAIVALARDLDLGCVVEGIETTEQLDALPDDVDGQGFLLGHPTDDPSAIEDFARVR